MITIQEYDIELQHIKGFENHLADILSRNLTILEVREIENLKKLNIFSGNKILLKTDQAVLKNLKNLADRLRIIREELINDPVHNKHRKRRTYCFEGTD